MEKPVTTNRDQPVDTAFGSIRARGGLTELTVTGASYGSKGINAKIGYAFAPSACGEVLVAATAHGVCWIGLHESRELLQSELITDLPRAEFARDDRCEEMLQKVVALADGSLNDFEIPIDIRGTAFQIAVWRELCAIPRGATRSYGEIARRIDRPEAVRAVGHANGSNPLAIVIPCHRAIGANGALTGYRWGVGIKQALLAREGALRQPALMPSKPARLSTAASRFT